MYRYVSTGDSLVVNANLTVTNNTISGTGSVNFHDSEDGATLTIQDDFSGTLNEPNISVSVGDSFTFTGTNSGGGDSFHGTATIKIGDMIYTITDQSFFKE